MPSHSRLRLVRVTCAFLVCGSMVGSPTHADDFWLQPSEPWTAPATTISMTLQVGDRKSRQRSQMPRHRIVRFEAAGPDSARVDLRDQLRVAGADDDAQLSFESPGTYVLVLESDNRAHRDLEADAFNEYIQSEGLTPALEHRTRTGRMDAPGSEK